MGAYLVWSKQLLDFILLRELPNMPRVCFVCLLFDHMLKNRLNERPFLLLYGVIYRTQTACDCLPLSVYNVVSWMFSTRKHKQIKNQYKNKGIIFNHKYNSSTCQIEAWRNRLLRMRPNHRCYVSVANWFAVKSDVVSNAQVFHQSENSE